MTVLTIRTICLRHCVGGEAEFAMSRRLPCIAEKFLGSAGPAKPKALQQHQKQKGRINPAFSLRHAGTLKPAKQRRANYMLEIMTSPKPEQDTCVAPSIKRAKS